MLVRVNVGSSLDPKTKNLEDTTLLRDALGTIPEGSQVTLDGVSVSAADLGRTLKDLNIKDGAHILYSSKQNSGKLD